MFVIQKTLNERPISKVIKWNIKVLKRKITHLISEFTKSELTKVHVSLWFIIAIAQILSIKKSHKWDEFIIQRINYF